MTLAKRIRDYRYAKGWGPDELAQKADISRTALYQIECGKTETPRAGTLRRIARALEISVDNLLGHEALTDADSVSEIMAAEIFAAPPVEAAAYGRPEYAMSRTLRERKAPSQPLYAPRPTISSRETEMLLKFKEILASPLGESVGRIVEESYRLLPIMRVS